MKILITGGAGFIGASTARFFADAGHSIVIVDDYSRPGSKGNTDFLLKNIKDLKIIKANVLDTNLYSKYVQQADAIIHLAGQTAVTTSVQNPIHDFSANLVAGVTLLELIRLENPDAVCIYSSTNKVYGDMGGRILKKDDQAKAYVDDEFPNGVSESEPLSFASPYGCSKGSLDQYFLDYASTFGLKTVVLRQSCIYGPLQQGMEDQGWVSHFCNQALSGNPITVFGDGYQVRDLLYIDDLIDLYAKILATKDLKYGSAFNVGGGKDNAHSLLQVLSMLSEVVDQKINIKFSNERIGDQKLFVSNNSLASETFSWHPTTSVKTGLRNLVEWQRDSLAQ